MGPAPWGCSQSPANGSIPFFTRPLIVSWSSFLPTNSCKQLNGVVPKIGNGVAPAFEIMIVNSAIRNMIREGKSHQIDSVIYAGRSEGMITMDASICELVEKGRISLQNAETFSVNPEQVMRKLQKQP